MDVTKAINDIKAGKIEYRLDKTNIIHVPRQKQHVMYVYILTDIRRMRQMIRQIGDQFLFMTSRSMQMRFLIRFSRMKTTVWKEQQKQAILKRFKASRENKVRQKRLTEI